LGSAYRDLGQSEQAIRLYNEALRIAGEIGDRSEEGILYQRMSLMYRTLGQTSKRLIVMSGPWLSLVKLVTAV